MVNAEGLHAFTYKRAPSSTIRRWTVNDIVWRAVTPADIPAIMEPPGLARMDGKRPDGLLLIPCLGTQDSLSLGM